MNAKSIKATENALKKIINLIEETSEEHLSLRIYIIGGGCSGFQYGFAFVKDFDENEDLIVNHQIDNKSVNLLVDYMCLQYLKGAELDYIEDLQGSRFTINNPNAITTCGCGSSFSV